MKIFFTFAFVFPLMCLPTILSTNTLDDETWRFEATHDGIDPVFLILYSQSMDNVKTGENTKHNQNRNGLKNKMKT